METIEKGPEEPSPLHSIARPLLWTGATMLLIAIPPVWPYGYYTLLRLVVCGASIYALFYLPRISPGIAVGLVLTALLFNPIIPVHLSKPIWIPIDISVAVFLFILGLRRPVSSHPSEDA